MPSGRAALGFRVKSGWATAVLVVGGKPAAPPQVTDRRVVELSDPAVPSTRQPYHAVMEASPRTGAKLARRLTSVVRRAARTSVRRLLKDYRGSGHHPVCAGIVVGSVIDPAAIANDHIRAHALEGRLFRTVLEQALRSEGLECAIVLERAAYAQGAKALRQPERVLKRAVTALGRSIQGPWRADEKTAALAAWMALRGYRPRDTTGLYASTNDRLHHAPVARRSAGVVKR